MPPVSQGTTAMATDTFFEQPQRSMGGDQSRRDSIVLSNEEHAYTPLVDSLREIRLLSIEPGTEGSEIRISLRTTTLMDSVNQYTCLSYAWGKLTSPDFVLVDGRRRPVLKNLSLILHRIRSLGMRNNLWIDALCINQRDVPEKAQQVQLMGQIFSGAKEVLVAIDEKRHHERLHDDNLNASIKRLFEDLAGDSHLHDVQYFAMARSTATDNTLGAMFRQLLDSAWFTRTWTVQEVCLARRATVLFSWGMLPWSTFVSAFRNWERHRRGCCAVLAESFPRGLQAACYQMYNHVESIEATISWLNHGQHFVQVFPIFQHLVATDPRDKIFAFRGLHTAAGEMPIANYSKATSVVFEELAVWVMNDTHSLRLLAMDLQTRRHSASWVPNFAMRPPIQANYWRGRLHFLETYNCAINLEWWIDHVTGDGLRTRGIEVDQVECVAPYFLSLGRQYEHADHLRKWRAFADCRDLEATFWATMIAGCAEDTNGIRTAQPLDISRCRRVPLHLMDDTPLVEDEDSVAFVWRAHTTAVLGRRLYRTISGRLGVGPKRLARGDAVWILAGGRAPFILRQTELHHSGTLHYTLIGHTYVHGVMHGEVEIPSDKVQECSLK